MTFGELKTQLITETHPSGLPENLAQAYVSRMKEALYQAQKWVVCLQDRNTAISEFDCTYFTCNLSVTEAPRGRILRVYTADETLCDRVEYVQTTFDRILCASREVQSSAFPTNTNKPELPAPFRWASEVTDRLCGRARFGFWAYDDERIYLAPWIQSTEKIIVEYQGLKRTWSDQDEVSNDPELFRLIRLYVQKEFALSYEADKESWVSHQAEFLETLRDMIHECREERLIRASAICTERTLCDQCGVPLCTPEDTEAPAEDDIVWAFTSDIQSADNDDDPEADTAVSELIKSWSPEFIITGGDNVSTGDDYSNIDELYGDYISDTISENHFWPALGNHDYTDPPNGLADYLEFFTLPGNERYYSFVRAGIHFFVLNSESAEPDGRNITSVQHEWLRVQAAISTVKWKIAIVHKAPYGIGNHAPGNSTMRWDYKDLGLDLVMSGHDHNYARFEVDGFPYLVAGTGGAKMDSPCGVDTEGFNQECYDGNYGAIKCSVNCERLLFEFYTVEGTLIDSLTVEK